MNTCATCQWMQFYVTGKPELGGECMYDPPVVAVVRNSVVTLRPSVLAMDRCSEWTEKVDDKLFRLQSEARILLKIEREMEKEH